VCIVPTLLRRAVSVLSIRVISVRPYQMAQDRWYSTQQAKHQASLMTQKEKRLKLRKINHEGSGESYIQTNLIFILVNSLRPSSSDELYGLGILSNGQTVKLNIRG